MRIDPNLGIPEGQQPERVQNSTSQAAKPLQISSASASDQASLSPDATQLSNLSLALVSAPDVRQERVSAVSQALQNGSYSVSNQQIAGSMLRDFRMTTSLTQ